MSGSPFDAGSFAESVLFDEPSTNRSGLNQPLRLSVTVRTRALRAPERVGCTYFAGTEPPGGARKSPLICNSLPGGACLSCGRAGEVARPLRDCQPAETDCSKGQPWFSRGSPRRSSPAPERGSGFSHKTLGEETCARKVTPKRGATTWPNFRGRSEPNDLSHPILATGTAEE